MCQQLDAVCVVFEFKASLGAVLIKGITGCGLEGIIGCGLEGIIGCGLEGIITCGLQEVWSRGERQVCSRIDHWVQFSGGSHRCDWEGINGCVVVLLSTG